MKLDLGGLIPATVLPMTDDGRIDEAGLLAHLRTRVKGQDAILQDVAKLIRLQAAKQQKDKPIANLIFLGPTGTGNPHDGADLP